MPGSIKSEVESVKARYPARTWPVAEGRELGLTERQVFAIYNYTIVTYIFVNRALRRNDVTDPEFVYFQSFIEALSTGLAGLANYVPGALLTRYLGRFPGIEDIYKVSNVVREAAYSSTSYAEVPLADDYKILLKGQIGKNIEAVSAYPTEHEVLFDSSMLHLVSRVEDVEWEPVPGTPEIMTVVSTDEVLANTINIHFSHL